MGKLASNLIMAMTNEVRCYIKYRLRHIVKLKQSIYYHTRFNKYIRTELKEYIGTFYQRSLIQIKSNDPYVKLTFFRLALSFRSSIRSKN